MPHITVEYSANLEGLCACAALVDAVHSAMLATQVFEIGAVRTRAEPRALYKIADGNPAHIFVNIVIRIGQGRDIATRKKIGQTVFDAAAAFLEPVFAATTLALSLYVEELDDAGAFRKNNLHQAFGGKGR